VIELYIVYETHASARARGHASCVRPDREIRMPSSLSLSLSLTLSFSQPSRGAQDKRMQRLIHPDVGARGTSGRAGLLFGSWRVSFARTSAGSIMSAIIINLFYAHDSSLGPSTSRRRPP